MVLTTEQKMDWRGRSERLLQWSSGVVGTQIWVRWVGVLEETFRFRINVGISAFRTCCWSHLFSTGSDVSPPGDIWKFPPTPPGDIFGGHDRYALAPCRGQGTLLTTRQWRGQRPTARVIQPQMPKGPRLRNCGLDVVGTESMIIPTFGHEQWMGLLAVNFVMPEGTAPRPTWKNFERSQRCVRHPASTRNTYFIT